MTNQLLHDVVASLLAVILVTATVVAHVLMNGSNTAFLDSACTLVLGYFFGRLSGTPAAPTYAVMPSPPPPAARPALVLPTDPPEAPHGGG